MLAIPVYVTTQVLVYYWEMYSPQSFHSLPVNYSLEHSLGHLELDHVQILSIFETGTLSLSSTTSHDAEASFSTNETGSFQCPYSRHIQPTWYKDFPLVNVCSSSLKIYCSTNRAAKSNLPQALQNHYYWFQESSRTLHERESSVIHTVAFMKMVAMKTVQLSAQLETHSSYYHQYGRHWYIGMARVPHMRNTNMHRKISAKTEHLATIRLFLFLTSLNTWQETIANIPN